MKQPLKKFFHSRGYKRGAIFALAFLVGILVGGKILVDKQIIFQGQDYQTVAQVVDGDTLKLESGQLVRLIGINAPELGSCYGSEAQKALVDLVQGKQVRLAKDISGKDKFDRLLRYVILPGL